MWLEAPSQGTVWTEGYGMLQTEWVLYGRLRDRTLMGPERLPPNQATAGSHPGPELQTLLLSHQVAL